MVYSNVYPCHRAIHDRGSKGVSYELLMAICLHCRCLRSWRCMQQHRHSWASSRWKGWWGGGGPRQAVVRLPVEWWRLVDQLRLGITRQWMIAWTGGWAVGVPAFPPPVLPHPPPPPWWGEEAGGTVPRWRRRVGSRRKLGPHEPSPAVGDCYLKKKKSRLLTKILVRRWCRWSDVPSYNVHVVKSTFVVEIIS